MLDFILNYWLEFLFGIIATGLGILSKYFYNLYKKEKQHQKIEEQKVLSNEFKAITEKEHNTLLQIINENKEQSQEADEKIQAEISETQQCLNTLQLGVLEIQGRAFKADCRQLLEQDHTITQEEWEEISKSHDTYNQLGGNHNGDRLYEDVSFKYHSSLTN